MINFKGRHFEDVIILMSVRWYLAYPLSYRQIEELMAERGVVVIIQPSIKGLSNTLLY